MTNRPPETRYAENGDISIAYQVVGDGELTLFVLPGLFSNVDSFHELPGYSETLNRLAEFSRVVTFDKRGQGLSDRIEGVPSLEERVSDIRAVMKALDVDKVALLGCSDGGSMAMLFAATYPEHTIGLMLFGAFAKAFADDDYPFMPVREERQARVEAFAANLGKGMSLNMMDPDRAADADVRRLYGRAERASATPKSLLRYFKLVIDTDLRPILPAIRVPTLVLHHRNDIQAPFASGQHLADSIDGARFVDLGLGGHAFWSGDSRKLADEIRGFLIGDGRAAVATDRTLATILFTDIVGSTRALSEMGDAKWRDLLDSHDKLAAQTVSRFRGRLIKSTGDGLLAIFDSPGRAIQCAGELTRDMTGLGISLRNGIHTGEIETRGDDISGIAVHTAARILETADAGEIHVSGIVAALVAGSPQFSFSDCGPADLAGIPGPVHLLEARIGG